VRAARRTNLLLGHGNARRSASAAAAAALAGRGALLGRHGRVAEVRRVRRGLDAGGLQRSDDLLRALALRLQARHDQVRALPLVQALPLLLGHGA